MKGLPMKQLRMKALKSTQEAWKVCNKILKKKKRYNDTVDAVLFEEAIIHAKLPVLVKGLPVQDNQSITINDIPCTLYVLYNPYILFFKGASIAMSVTDTVNQVVVFVDDDFMNMTDDTKGFIIEHEIGHIVYNHIAQVGVRDIDVEHEADLYASYHSDPIKALQELKRLTIKRNHKEIDIRIQEFIMEGCASIC